MISSPVETQEIHVFLLKLFYIEHCLPYKQSANCEVEKTLTSVQSALVETWGLIQCGDSKQCGTERAFLSLWESTEIKTDNGVKGAFERESWWLMNFYTRCGQTVHLCKYNVRIIIKK